MPVICDLYCRVSTDDQAEDGYSLGEQEERLRAYAKAQGWTVNACYVDPGLSGAKLDRPGLQCVIQDAQAHRINKVVTYKLDRLSRSQKDTLYLIEDIFMANGVDYVSMTENFDCGTPIGRAVLNLLGTFAQLEREQIKERMTMGRIASAKQGNWRGGSGVPIGYRYNRKTNTSDGQLVIEPYEARIVREVFDQFLAGRTFHAIWQDMRDKYTTAYGQFGSGGAAIIPIMLRNRCYIGEIKYCGVWYAGKHEPIIDSQTFQRAQDMMVEYQATLNDHRRKPFKTGHLLTGFLYCGECGSRWCYHACYYNKKDGTRVDYGTYCCYVKNSNKAMRKADSCSIPVWPASELEDVVWSQVLALRFEDLQASPNAEQLELQTLTARVSEIDKQRAKLVDLYTLGTLPFDLIEAKANALQAEKDRLLRQCDVIRRRSTRPSDMEISDALARVQTVYQSGTLEEQRDLLRFLIKKITLNQGREVVIEWNI